MARPITLFTGQWADLPLETLAEKAASFGYDGLELACWGDHFEVDKALSDDGYVKSRWDILNKYGLKCFAISNHLVGQAVSDAIIDARHKDILPPRCGAMAILKACARAPRKRWRTRRTPPS